MSIASSAQNSKISKQTKVLHFENWKSNIDLTGNSNEDRKLQDDKFVEFMAYFLNIRNSLHNINSLNIMNSFGTSNFDELITILEENKNEIIRLNLLPSKSNFNIIDKNISNEGRIIEKVMVGDIHEESKVLKQI